MDFNRISDYALVVGPFAVWMWRKMRRLETAMGLAFSTSTKHLPFIYTRLKEHDEALLIDTPEHPDIGLVNGELASVVRAKSRR